jgi:hypothetical protein
MRRERWEKEEERIKKTERKREKKKRRKSLIFIPVFWFHPGQPAGQHWQAETPDSQGFSAKKGLPAVLLFPYQFCREDRSPGGRRLP